MPVQSWITLAVGVLAVAGVVLSVSQRTRADNRAQSWLRITWCLERTVSENDDEAALAWKVFGTVSTTPFIARTDRDMLTAIANHGAEPPDLAEFGSGSNNEAQPYPEDQP